MFQSRRHNIVVADAWHLVAAGRRRDKGAHAPYIGSMRALIIVALFALLGVSIWFAGAAWLRIGGGEIPFYGYVAIAGGVLFSLLVGGGLMALAYYSSRHGYDDLSGGDGNGNGR